MSESQPSQPDALESRLHGVLAEYLEAVENGGDAAPAAWAERYPEFADELREFISGREQLNDAVAAAAEATFLSRDGENAPAIAGPRLRYFGDYELLEEIARGGMGVVYRARQVSLNRLVAVKMILSGELATKEDVARFRTEAEAAANLDHSGIVPIYEIGELDGRHYFSMKYIAGESLAQRLRQTRTQDATFHPPASDAEPIRETARLVAKISRAVHYAHQRGIIHRDLKPANILIDDNGAPHVTDFGLAKHVEADSQLTHTGAIVGTPSYMSPEQASGKNRAVTTAADIYGLGGILYALLSRRPPFEGNTPLDTLLKVQTEAPERLSRLIPAIDPDLDSICHKCLEKDPEARYRSAGELADDLERWLNGEPVVAAPPSLAGIFWRWLSTNFRSAACVVVLGIVIGFLVTDVIRGVLAHNVGNYLAVYRASFPNLEPPWMLRVIAAYPRWLHLVLVPGGVIGFLMMGWMTDRMVRPKSAAAAILAGMGLGSAAAATAFIAGIGWEFLVHTAVWPSQPDLELLAATIDGDTSYSGGRTLSDAYPQTSARRVLKKALADIQSTIPLGLASGTLVSVGLLFLPATLQTWTAFSLRRRGDGPARQLVHLLELSLPMSLLLIVWCFLLFDQPLLCLSLLAYPLATWGTVVGSRRWSRSARLMARLVVGGVGVAGLGFSAQMLFSPATGSGFSMGLLIVGAAAAAIAVHQQWPWWGRVIVYGAWGATFVWTEGVRGSFDPEVNHARMIACLVGSAIVALLVGLMAWHRHRSSAMQNLRQA